MIASEKIGSTGRAFLIDDKGQLIAHGDSSKVEKALRGRGENFLNHPAILKNNIVKKDESNEFSQYQYDSKMWRGTSLKTSLGWTLVFEQQVAEVVEPLNAIKRNALSVILGALILSIIMALVVSSFVVRPVKKLTKVTERISNGDFSAKEIEYIKSKDEIGALAKSVKKLSATVKIAMDMIR